MTDNAQIEMRIHQVKDELSRISTKLESLEKTLFDNMVKADQMQMQLAELRGKL